MLLPTSRINALLSTYIAVMSEAGWGSTQDGKQALNAPRSFYSSGCTVLKALGVLSFDFLDVMLSLPPLPSKLGGISFLSTQCF